MLDRSLNVQFLFEDWMSALVASLGCSMRAAAMVTTSTFSVLYFAWVIYWMTPHPTGFW